MNIYQVFDKKDPGFSDHYKPIGNNHYVIGRYRDGKFWHDITHRKDVIFSYCPDTNELSFDYSEISMAYFWENPDYKIIKKFIDKYVPGCTLETVLDLFYDSLKIE